MTGASQSAPVRKRVGRHRRDGAQCSCDLLLELVAHARVLEVLRAYGVDTAQLAEARECLHRSADPEPADWRLRLESRGTAGVDPQLRPLLAILRSADSHAYQLLDRAGVACSRLRKEIVEHGRSAPRPGPRRAPGRAPIPPSAGLEPANDAPNRGNPALRGPLPAREAETIPETDLDPDEDRCHRPPLDPLDPNDLAPLHGREPDLARLADALGRRSPRAPLLVGDHGSGRTLVASHLARMVNRPVFRLDAPRYEDDEDLRLDLDELTNCDGVAILDDLDRVPGDLAPPFLAALTQAWTSGRPPLLTIVSPETRARLQSWIPGLTETLDILQLHPLDAASVPEAVKLASRTILDGHGVKLASDTHPSEVTQLTQRYLAGLAMPGRALDVLDLACARTVRQCKTTVSRATILDIVSERSGLPRARIETGDDQALLDLESGLARRVVGHEDAIHTIAGLIRRNRAGFSSGRPAATVLLLGPSGVGKTEIAKALAAALYDGTDALVRLDMSEYAESHAVARVVGAPPGYVGHEQGGALTDPLFQRPHCVVLLDEIEKAHRDVHQLLLQVFDDGRLTDGRGRTVDFHHAVLVMTSNLGANLMQDDGDVEPDQVLGAARAAFPVELWNRIEAPLVMRPLTAGHMRRICKRLARGSSDRLFRERGIRYSLSEIACDQLIALAGDDPSLGARPLRHLLSREVESVLAHAILRGQLHAGTQVQVDLDRRGQVVLR